jgi:hypothetical protein
MTAHRELADRADIAPFIAAHVAVDAFGKRDE